MDAERQPRDSDPVVAIERALVQMRRDQQARMLQRRGRRPDVHTHPHHHDEEHAPGQRRGGPHDRSLGGAARFRLLDALESGPRTITELAQTVGVDQPRASRLVAEAVELGFARRGVDPADARRAVVELTRAGAERLAEAHAHRRDAVTAALADFTERETEEFARLLARFVASWPRDPGAAGD